MFWKSPFLTLTIGKNLQFTVDASKAGEGNLEITISARGRNIPTQVHPQGSARFAVSFVPLEAIDHIINITFNKELVTGAPFTAKIHTDPNHIVVSGQSLAATAVGKPSFFTLSNVTGNIEERNGNVIFGIFKYLKLRYHKDRTWDKERTLYLRLHTFHICGVRDKNKNLLPHPFVDSRVGNNMRQELYLDVPDERNKALVDCHLHNLCHFMLKLLHMCNYPFS